MNAPRAAFRANWATWAALALMACGAWLSNTVLFVQTVQGNTQLTRNIPGRLGAWNLIEETPPTASEIQGLETRDVIKRTYSNGSDYIELVVAYIAHSSRKSAHAQEACLRGAGAMVSDIGMRRMTRVPVEAKSIAIDLQDRRQRVYYWYKIGRTYTADYLGSSLRMFLGGLVGKKSQGASLVRLLTPERRGESLDQVNGRLEDFSAQLIPALEATLP